MTISITPNVLVIHLKRFSFGGFSGKINKPVQFDLRLDIPSSATKIDKDTENIKVADSKKDFNYKRSKKDKRNMDDKIEDTMIPYDLVGVVVHHGSSIHSGHYVAFVKVSVMMVMMMMLK
jgi:ubiquitin carboxyl-terminal hydrolase 36/42